MNRTDEALPAASNAKRPAKVDALLLGLLLVSLGANVWQGPYQTWQQKRSQLRLSTGLIAGDVAPPLAAELLDGGKSVVPFEPGATTILYIHRATCIWCERNLPNLRALAALPSPYKLVMLDLDAEEDVARTYSRKIGLSSAPFYFHPTPEAAKQYRLGATPVTLLIGPAGKVIRAWAGAYTENTRVSIEEALHTKLPGLALVDTK